MIYTATLDLMNPLPLNEDMPTNLSVLKKGESKSWSIHLRAISDLDELAKNVTDMTKAAVVDAERYNIFDGESFDVDIVSSAKPQVRLLAPNGVEKIMKVVRQGSNQYKVVYCSKEGKGLYRMTVEKSGKISTAYFSVLYNWSDYVDAARKALVLCRDSIVHTKADIEVERRHEIRVNLLVVALQALCKLRVCQQLYGVIPIVLCLQAQLAEL